jgi:hypothetical protein
VDASWHNRNWDRKNSNERGRGEDGKSMGRVVQTQGNGKTRSTNSSERRYQKVTEKTPLEKAKEQRDARLEQQRKEGITSDFYKDVYSVSFTESAQ